MRFFKKKKRPEKKSFKIFLANKQNVRNRKMAPKIGYQLN